MNTLRIVFVGVVTLLVGSQADTDDSESRNPVWDWRDQKIAQFTFSRHNGQIAKPTPRVLRRRAQENGAMQGWDLEVYPKSIGDINGLGKDFVARLLKPEESTKEYVVNMNENMKHLLGDQDALDDPRNHAARANEESRRLLLIDNGELFVVILFKFHSEDFNQKLEGRETLDGECLSTIALCNADDKLHFLYDLLVEEIDSSSETIYVSRNGVGVAYPNLESAQTDLGNDWYWGSDKAPTMSNIDLACCQYIIAKEHNTHFAANKHTGREPDDSEWMLEDQVDNRWSELGWKRKLGLAGCFLSSIVGIGMIVLAQLRSKISKQSAKELKEGIKEHEIAEKSVEKYFEDGDDSENYYSETEQEV